MNENNKNEEIHIIKTELEELRNKLDIVTKKVEELAESFSYIKRAVRGEGMIIDLTRAEIINYLKKKPDGATARDVSKALGMSRSHTSAILNELHRSGYLKKGRFRREIKYFVKTDEE